MALNLQYRLKFWLLMIPRYTAKKTAKLQAEKEVSQKCPEDAANKQVGTRAIELSC